MYLLEIGGNESLLRSASDLHYFLTPRFLLYIHMLPSRSASRLEQVAAVLETLAVLSRAYQAVVEVLC